MQSAIASLAFTAEHKDVYGVVAAACRKHDYWHRCIDGLALRVQHERGAHCTQVRPRRVLLMRAMWPPRDALFLSERYMAVEQQDNRTNCEEYW